MHDMRGWRNLDAANLSVCMLSLRPKQVEESLYLTQFSHDCINQFTRNGNVPLNLQV